MPTASTTVMRSVNPRLVFTLDVSDHEDMSRAVELAPCLSVDVERADAPPGGEDDHAVQMRSSVETSS